MLGMTPSSYRSGGARTEIRFAVGECSLGSILVAKSDRGICAILLGDDPDVLTRDLQNRFREANLIGGDVAFEQLVAKVVGFIETPAIGLDLPLDVRGTAFQQRVWQVLRKIPAGSTATYADIAAQIGSPRSVRAVAQACAQTRLLWRFPAIVWSAVTERCRAIDGSPTQAVAAGTRGAGIRSIAPPPAALRHSRIARACFG